MASFTSLPTIYSTRLCIDCSSFFLFSPCLIIFLLIQFSKTILWLGLQKDSSDARASSFLKILELIPQTSQPPLMLFVENVVGFEVCCRKVYIYVIFITNTLIFLCFSFFVLIKLCLVSDIWYTWENGWDFGKNSFCYTGIYFEPVAVWRAVL